MLIRYNQMLLVVQYGKFSKIFWMKGLPKVLLFTLMTLLSILRSYLVHLPLGRQAEGQPIATGGSTGVGASRYYRMICSLSILSRMRVLYFHSITISPEMALRYCCYSPLHSYGWWTRRSQWGLKPFWRCSNFEFRFSKHINIWNFKYFSEWNWEYTSHVCNEVPSLYKA